MQWSANVLASALTEAKLPKRELVRGVALALAISGGDDAWLWRPSPSALRVYVGAWGVPCLANQYDQARYKDSLRAQASEVVKLWDHNDEQWTWALIAPEWALRSVGDLALEGVNAPQGFQNSPSPITTDTVPLSNALRVTVTFAREALQRVRDGIASITDSLR